MGPKIPKMAISKTVDAVKKTFSGIKLQNNHNLRFITSSSSMVA